MIMFTSSQFNDVSINLLAHQIIRAEVKIATMFVQHNIPLALADELTPLFRDILWQWDCKRVFIKTNQNSLHNQWRYCSILSESTCWSHEDDNHGVISTQFLDMCMSSSSTAEGIFARMHEIFSKHSISWSNCVGIGLDNTSVNMGHRNSIKTRVVQKIHQYTWWDALVT